MTVTLKAPKASVGKQSRAFVAAVPGRVLHSFGKITRMTPVDVQAVRQLEVDAGDIPEDTPPEKLSATCVLTTRGANEWTPCRATVHR